MESASRRRKEQKRHDVVHKRTLPKVVAGGEPFFWDALREIKSKTRGAETGHISSSGVVCTGSPSTMSHSAWSTKKKAKFGRNGERQKCWRQDVVRLLDVACGIKRIDQKRYVGKTLTAHMGCNALPVYLVRPVETESVARRLNCTEMDIGQIHNFLMELEDNVKVEKMCWDKNDIKDKGFATEYLMRATLVRNRFAKRVLEWLAPVRAQGVVPALGAARTEYVRAINAGQRRRAIQMGCLIVGGETGDKPIRPDDTFVLTMPVSAREAMAANNIGHLLLHGRGGVNQNVHEAIEYYEVAIRLGSAAAASNLGHIYYSGANDEVTKDGQRAKQLYMLAIERGERTSAPRNLAVMLLRGAPGLKIDTSAAVRWLLLGLHEGNNEARSKCEKTLRLTMQSWRFSFLGKGLKRDCIAALQEVELEKAGAFSNISSLLEQDFI